MFKMQKSFKSYKDELNPHSTTSEIKKTLTIKKKFFNLNKVIKDVSGLELEEI